MHFIFTDNVKILLLIHIYYNSKISENIIHISVINQLSNINLIKILQKVGGQMILRHPPFKKWGGQMKLRPPPFKKWGGHVPHPPQRRPWFLL